MAVTNVLDCSFWIEKDEYIKTAIDAIAATNSPITIGKISEQLTTCIVDSYDDKTSIFVYKSEWCSRISQILLNLDITSIKSRSNWETICMLLIDKRLGIVHPHPQPLKPSASEENIIQMPGNTDTASNIHPANTSNTTNIPIIPTPIIPTSIMSTPSTSSITSTATTKQNKLSPYDKQNIQDMFSKLKEDKMWKLSTGTIVEKKMEEFALSCTFENPVHSMVIDTDDKHWKKYLTDDEINEIKTFNSKSLPNLPLAMEELIASLSEYTDAVSLKKRLSQELECHACGWLRGAILTYLKLFESGHLPVLDLLEADMLRRVWFFLDTVFDDSKIKCRGGEKPSKASALSRNSERMIGGEEPMGKKLMGRRVDLLFTHQRIEYGCSECGVYDNQTKEFYDGSFKIVKVLRDMIYTLYKSAPHNIRELTLVGFVLFETKFTMLLCDAPAGYVTRIIRTKSLQLPEEEEDVSNMLLPILKATYKGRLLMEHTNMLVRKAPKEVEFCLNDSDIILPCYYVESGKKKRRRDSEA